MARGTKLNIFVGHQIDDSWTEVQTPKTKKISNEILEPQKHLLLFKKEKRRGKTVTLVGEFQLSKADATTTLKSLKKKLGCGGSYKDGWMEFQGELKEKLKELLTKSNFRFRHNH